MSKRKAGTKTLIFTIGRMNPPHLGHMKLIETLMLTNKDLPSADEGHGQVYVILSSDNKDKNKNPLDCPTKRRYLQEQGMIAKIKTEHPDLADIAVNIICMDELTTENCQQKYIFNPNMKSPSPILNQLCGIVESEWGQDITHAQLIVGQDQQKAFGWLKTSFFDVNHIDFITKNDGALERPELTSEEKNAYIKNDDMEIPLEAMSATIMRGLVKNNKLAKFVRLAQASGLSEAGAKELFDDLEASMGAEGSAEPASAKKTRKPRTTTKTTTAGGRRKRRGKNQTRKRKSKKHTRRTYKKKY
jgi:hypothetical protein